MHDAQPVANGKSVPASNDGLSDEEVVETDSPQTPLNMTLRRDILGGPTGLGECEREETEGEGGPQAGCTAVVALINGERLIVANAGDSR